jgi:UPF0755 protein
MKSLFSGKKKFVIAGILLLGMFAAFQAYTLFYRPNTIFEEKAKVIFIQENTTLDKWLGSAESREILRDADHFERAASMKKCSTLKQGRYRILKNSSNNTIINMLRSGNQEALHLRIDDVHTMTELAGKLGRNLKSDSTTFIKAFQNDSICKSFGFNTITIACLISPNTYDFFWTITPIDFLNRMKKIHDSYWTDENQQKAKRLNLTPTEVTILASIVKAETAKKEEASKIAGLYLNRLRIDMALQSDPTAVYGREEHVQRVSYEDLRNDSPYNTYLHTGLPPGPIAFSEQHYLDAVLNPAKHDFIFMCAEPGGTGFHQFARTLDQHNVYRREYTRWLESKGIR